MSEKNNQEHQGDRRHVYVLDYLMLMRRDMLKGLLAIHLGDITITRMVAFVDGYLSCQDANGIKDEEYSRFFHWLRDVKQEFPTEGWAAKYLRYCEGDHERAIRKFLDFVAEFVALREREQQGG